MLGYGRVCFESLFPLSPLSTTRPKVVASREHFIPPCKQRFPLAVVESASFLGWQAPEGIFVCRQIAHDKR